MVMLAIEKQYPKLLHEAGAGQPCLACGDDCPGLEVHFWRKICINCRCPVSDHQQPTTVTEVSKGKLLDDNIKAQFECGNYSWIPPGLSKDLVEEYMMCLPPEARPIVGTVGEQYRRKLIMTQLPSHDHTPSASLGPTEAEELTEFSRLRYESSYGVGEVRQVTADQAEMFDCRTCQSPLEENQLGVFAERAGPNCIWCVACFRCDVCEEPLVDLHYFYKDGEILCGRHHAELLKHRCAACDELILAKEYTLAEERNWHLNHFCCWECDSMLGGQRYVSRDNHPFCINCYDDLYAPLCKKCVLPIGLDNAHMVHKDQHWHATESCFYCENCQVSLIASPFLQKFDEIFCSSACAQEYSSCEGANNKIPQIQIIEDNPVDNIQGILRKDSSPTSPKEHKRKVMFDVDATLDIPESDKEVKRSYSEEEFEYLEQSLNDGNVEIDIPSAKGNESVSPLSESTLSNSPLSDNNVEETFFEKEQPPPSDEDVVMLEDVVDTDGVVMDTGDVTMETRVENPSSENICNGDAEPARAEPARADTLQSTEIRFEVSDVSVDLDDAIRNTAVVTMETEAFSTSSDEEGESIEEVTTAQDEDRPRHDTADNKATDKHSDSGSDKAADKENEPASVPRKPAAKSKLSSASFNRVLRRIDQHGNDSLFVERPGKRLRNRPRSLSSLGSSRANSNIEQRENLVNMYALAPDIADMIASVYRDQNSSINTTAKSVDTTRQENRTLGSPTSATPCLEDDDDPSAPSRSLHKRNASYEAAELVMQLDVESDEEKDDKKKKKKIASETPPPPDAGAAVATTKNITSEPENKGKPTKDTTGKSPRKSIKQRLSFRKKKDKKARDGDTTVASGADDPGTPTKPKKKNKRPCSIM